MNINSKFKLTNVIITGLIAICLLGCKYTKTEEEKIRFAKELGDTETLLIHYKNRLKSINKNIEYGFREIG